jgi:pimeloyl-ACP methyl ester carboxylesterase
MKRLFLLSLIALIACSSDDPDTVDTTDTAEPAKSPLKCGSDALEFQMLNVGEVEFNVGCRGQGTTVVLLHGFPEFWYGWKQVVDELAGDLRLVVPDQRGYNLSDKPDGLDAYKIEKLMGDIAGLIKALGDDKVVLVGHDWGGVVAWGMGAMYPDLIDKLIILNAPHPQVFARELAENPEQQQASGYISFFMGDVESTLSANDFALMAGTVFNDAFSDEDIAKYKEAWAKPGALTAMLNWYRANFSDGAPATGDVVVDKVPTLVLWGMKDTALLPGNLDGLDKYVTDLTVKKFENATHWINHEEPAAVAAAIRSFIFPEE